MRGRIIEYTFFFGALLAVGYMVWQMVAPFISALALSAIIVIICYPLFNKINTHVTRGRRSLSAFIASFIVLTAVVVPLAFASTVLVNEFVSFYRSLDTGGQLPIDTLTSDVEAQIQAYIPTFDLDLSEQVRQSVSWFTENIGSIFAGTLSVFFSVFIALLGTFYLFRDGERLVNWLISISPLKNVEDRIIMSRLAQSVRSVATGTVFVALLQGFLAMIGFVIFGVPQPIFWGTMAALGALLPGVGTLIIMVPAVGYLFLIGDYAAMGGLAIWAVTMVVVVDNFVSPYLMSRGNDLHPFVVLLAVLGGLSLFGPIGFIIGPVMVSLFLVLLELYSTSVAGEEFPPEPREEPKAAPSKRLAAKKVAKRPAVKKQTTEVLGTLDLSAKPAAKRRQKSSAT